MTYIPSPTSTIGKNIFQGWSPVEKIPHQRSVARLLVMPAPDTHWIEYSGTVCPPRVFHHSELEMKSSRALKRTYAQAGE